ncbi:tannase/feruloyl esterase family alpha/beta hydrolase [Actinoplanes sp. ATCC 53533]|uniref:tannase/feruloyl esterase family alpha/beta hydrolase n=1 Tax=Actinoplanes sp. ATCC 53533 TaxID=1288362 RepID=UPI000F7AF20B|nr:tannase/feruloyl esterase family alpha/beta hydrolase [Actinoplanes sp. ATCC 53533]RSM57734.1 tannase/feruloyl esterase family alpha/beta hydrolase [Actinoplanes sp. ATCC 53533]
MRRRIGFALTALTALTAILVPAGPAAAASNGTIRPVRECASLVGDFALPSGVAHVTVATPVPAAATEPAHCDVRGIIDPAVRFQLRLPTSTFAGRYLQYGCGGFCGQLDAPAFPTCGGRPGADMAVGATDDGHVGGGVLANLDGRWGADNQAARDDWTFRAPHVVSQAAKRLIATYYGSPPRRSYFTGCSNGGREGLLLAQRYPTDFDGIAAGAPAFPIAPLAGVFETWVARANTAADGTPILTGDKLPALHAAVVAACDDLDGLVDGQLADPRACRYDPAALACPAGADRPDCLTPAQVRTVHKLYAGPTDAAGRRLYPGGEPYGSELAWFAWVVPVPELGGGIAAQLSDNYLRYLGYPVGTPHSSLADFRFTTAEFHRLAPEGAKGNAMSLDLSRFRRAGGKLVIWHGWADSAIPPVGTLDYYQRLWQRDGSLRQTQQYARVFMVPTMYHCADGSALTEFDPLPELVRWTEHGAAPDRVVAVGRTEPQGPVVRSRPVFPYPLRARYDGSGSVDDANNFVPAAPRQRPNDVIDWVGAGLYAGPPGPVSP